MSVEVRAKPWLSTRDKGILERLRDGMAPKQVAMQMGLSYPTLKFYLIVIRAKLGVETSNHAVIIAIRMRLISLYERE